MNLICQRASSNKVLVLDCIFTHSLKCSYKCFNDIICIKGILHGLDVHIIKFSDICDNVIIAVVYLSLLCPSVLNILHKLKLIIPLHYKGKHVTY